MQELRDIVEVKELRDANEVNVLCKSGDWDLLSAGVGPNDEGVLGSLYILGRPYKNEEPVEWM